MRLATWNVNSLGVRLPQVLDWLRAQHGADTPIDVLALQELKLPDEKFPHAAFEEAGYHALCFGQKSYNGVALLARSACGTWGAVQRNLPNLVDEQARLLAADLPYDDGRVRVVGAYFPNGQSPGSDKFEYKLSWLHALRDWLREELSQSPQLVLMGDFNITRDDADVWDPEGMRGQIHCTDEERHHLQALLGLGLHDALRLFDPPPKSYTWWDYRELGFRRNRGLRIDHIYVSDTLKAKALACGIDRAPRRNERPSDHTPVWLSLA